VEITATDNYFFELLQVALWNREKLSYTPTKEEWVSLFSEAKKQTLVGVLLPVLGRLPKEQRPPMTLLLQWVGLAKKIEQISSLHRIRVAELIQIFYVAGFHSCILKGMSTSKLYPNPQSRQCGDIDLWVDGNRNDIMTFLHQEKFGINHIYWHEVSANIFDDVETEIHIHPAWFYNPFYNYRLQCYFEREKSNQMVGARGGDGCVTISFNAVYSLVHLYHHLMDEGVGMRQIVDYYYILVHLPADERQKVVKDINWLGLSKFLASVMYVLHVACGLKYEYLLCRPNEGSGIFLLKEIVAAGNFGKFDARKHIRAKENWFQRNRRKFIRQLRFIRLYPAEVLSAPFWKLWHWTWRKVKT